MIDLDELERKARAATSGPWQYAGDYPVVIQAGLNGPIVCDVSPGTCATDQEAANGTYIAAASPDRVLALIAEVRRLRAEVKEKDAVIWALRGDQLDLAAENARLRDALSKVCVAAAYYGGDYVEREVDAVLDAALNPQEHRDASTR